MATATAASADPYPDDNLISVGDPTVEPGQTVAITVTGLPEGTPCIDVDTNSAPAGSDHVVDDIVDANGTSATFDFTGGTVPGPVALDVYRCVAPAASIVESAVFASAREYHGSITLTVVPAGTGGGALPGSGTTTPGLPPTGGELPAAALWLGVGAIGIGAIAVTAAVARRRAATNR